MSAGDETYFIEGSSRISKLVASPPKDPATPPPAKRKRKHEKVHHVIFQGTFKKGSWSYFHLSLVTPGATLNKALAASQSLDPVSTLSLLRPPLSSFLGLHGSSISIDILKTQGRDVWIRVPRLDASAFEAALSNWVGLAETDMVLAAAGETGRVQVAWRVIGKAETLGRLGDGSQGVVGDGSDLFES